MRNVRRPAWALPVALAFLFGLAGQVRAADVEIYPTGSGETLGYRLKNTTETRYAVDIEVTRLDPGTGAVITKRIDQITLGPRADISLGSARQQGAEVRYRVANVRVAGGSSDTGARRDSSLPAPYPVMFGK